MKSPRIAVLLAVLAVCAIAGLRSGLAQAVTNLRILAPQNGQKLTTDFVELRFQLVNPAIASSPTPTFQLQLDGGDPVRTASTDYTFTGLAPGSHTILVQLVDANNTPIAGSTNAVQFTVTPPPQPRAAGPGITANAEGPRVEPVALHQEPEPAPGEALPNTGSALPLLSIIGFGVLLGGIASALKTR